MIPEIEDMKKPYSEVVGKLTFSEPVIKHENSEFAAWFTDYALMPGEYELRCAVREDGYPALFAEAIPAEIVNEDNCSRLHGVPSGSNDRSRIGQKTEQSFGVGQIHIDGRSDQGISAQMTTDLVYTRDHGYHRLHFDEDSADYSGFFEKASLHKTRKNMLDSLSKSGSAMANESILKNALANELLTLDAIGEIKDSKEKSGPIDLDMSKVMTVDYELNRKTGKGLKGHGLVLCEALADEHKPVNFEGKVAERIAESIIDRNDLKKHPESTPEQALYPGF